MAQTLAELLSGYAAAPFEYFGYGKKPPPRVDSAVRSPVGFGFEDPEARAYAPPDVPAQTVAKDISDFVYSPHLSPEYKQRFREEVINKPFTGIGLPGLLAGTYEAGKSIVNEGINTADRWLNATRQQPGAKATDDLVLPIEDRGTENYQLNPNRIEQHDVLAPLGLASMGSPVSALGRETLRGGAKVGRPSAQAAIDPLEGWGRFRQEVVRAMGRDPEGSADIIMPESRQAIFEAWQANGGNLSAAREQYRSRPAQSPDAPIEPSAEPKSFYDHWGMGKGNDKLLSDAGKRSSLPGMIQGAVENVQGSAERAGRGGAVTPASVKDLPIESGQRRDGLESWSIKVPGGGIIEGHVLDGGKTFKLDGVRVPFDERGQGTGVALYQRLVDEAHARGMEVVSDNTVSEAAQHVYEALGRRGYQVERNPDAKLPPTGGRSLSTHDSTGDPVFRVLPSPRRGDRSSGAANASESLKPKRGFGGPIPD